MKLVNRKVTVILVAVVMIGCIYIIYNRFSDKFSNEGPHITVVFKSLDSSTEFWQHVRAGIDEAAKEFNAKVEIVGTKSEKDITGQIQILDDTIKSKPDVIVMAAADYNALVPEAQKIKKAGIPLITIDSELNSDIPKSFIATDNVQAGKKIGEALAGLVNPDSTIAIISHVKVSATAIQREQGFESGLTEELRKNIDGIYYSDASQEKAYEITKNLLIQKPYIEGVAGLNENSALGAGKAIKELGLSGKVKLVGFDSSVDEMKLVEEGVMQATVVQKPFNMGYLSIKTAVQLLKNRKVDKRIDTDSQVITKENMNTIENQKLLFPFIEK